ncbi:caprin-2 isoform X4 [Sphaerodactylus townsendi]|uniref:caprin-2 isoform X4 n=1 Tax=Sphaerodactylus townsendi TaxID=933632 RepID=UPI0020270FB0|nr:caprin-2 isoform X4 [Sphaerodactylus townsendi]
MVQLSQSPLRRPSSSCHSEEGEEKSMKPAKQQVTQGSPGDNQPPLSPLQATLHSAATAAQAYETYIDNGLICLKHKIRNIEKKKIKLEDYKDRLKRGESLNQDQLEAVEKYDEVIHNLEFAKELQKTFSGLSQDLLKAQRKAQRRENIMKLEAEKKKLRAVLQVQYVLQNFTQENVQKDFKAGLNGATYLPPKDLDYLIKFAKLTCPGRSETLSVEDQMEQSSLYFWDLLEGSEKTVVGTTYKHLKHLLSKLLDSGYFENIPAPCNAPEKEELKEEIPGRPERTRQLSKAEFVKELEPQMDCAQSEIQSQEFLNRRYLCESDYSAKKSEELKVWEMEQSKKTDLPRSWETLVDMEEQEQKKQKQESLKPLESARQQGKKQEVSRPWEVKEEDHRREVSVPWVARVKDQQDPPKLWTTKAKEELEQKQELTKTWVSQTREETVPKVEPVKPWAVREEVVQKKQSPGKPWVAHIGEEMESKTQSPKTWVTPEEPQQIQLLSNHPKAWGATNLLPKEPSGPKKSDLEPKEVPKPLHQPAAEFCSTSSLPKDPVLRREKLQDLISQIQGTYNFMQESLLDFDKPSQSAVGSSQSPPIDSTGNPSACKDQKLPSQNDFPEQSVQAAASPVTLRDSNTSLASDRTTSGSGSETEHGTPERPQAPIPLSSDSQRPLTQSAATMSPMPQANAFPSPPSSSSTVTVKAAPFQAMQTVFKVNAPLPPRREQDMKENSPHSAGYNQNFSTASTQTPLQCKLQSTQNAGQTTFSQESGPNAANYLSEGTVPASNGSLTFHTAQTTPFPRPPPAFVSTRGSARGPIRGTRSVTNTYRSPGGYKASFEAYRGSPSVSNGSYGQLQLPGRDYSGVQYPQREMNYQQNYKRGGINSGRANSRAGWSDSSQVSSPERDNETFNSGDSGQGDSRSITPVDMPVTSQAATILPVHVYPLPQQMRVAFSAARTSNLAPGTLDQPIVFDLLLNNLGETFDLQLGRFNCPVNGTYVFIFHMLKLAVNVPLYVNLMKNEEVLVSAYANDGAPDHETASNHAVLQLFQGDQIWLRLHRGAIYGSSWKYSTFSGYLLYQD